jgi:putative glutamine amidotransferase
VRKIIENCDGVLLPGSNADVDPARFNAPRSPHTAAADPRRDEVDDLLLDDAYKLRKPVLGICYGLQSLNVFRGGSLIQHIPEFLPEAARAKVDHEAGRNVAIAHTVEIVTGSMLAQVLGGGGENASAAKADEDRMPDAAALEALRHPKPMVVPVNSSHHQSANAIGEGLRIVARCPADGIIEAMEGIDPDHLVLAVQWHPERSVDLDEPSREIFRALIEEAEVRHKELAR